MSPDGSTTPQNTTSGIRQHRAFSTSSTTCFRTQEDTQRAPDVTKPSCRSIDQPRTHFHLWNNQSLSIFGCLVGRPDQPHGLALKYEDWTLPLPAIKSYRLTIDLQLADSCATSPHSHRQLTLYDAYTHAHARTADSTLSTINSAHYNHTTNTKQSMAPPSSRFGTFPTIQNSNFVPQRHLTVTTTITMPRWQYNNRDSYQNNGTIRLFIETIDNRKLARQSTFSAQIFPRLNQLGRTFAHYPRQQRHYNNLQSTCALSSKTMGLYTTYCGLVSSLSDKYSTFYRP